MGKFERNTGKQWKKNDSAYPTGKNGALIFPNGNGERCAKTIAPTANPGRIRRTTWLIARPGVGARRSWRHCRQTAASVFRDSSLEWQRPYLKRTAVRSHRL